MTLFVLHLAATQWMTGLIWFVQIVHYPLFEKVGGDFPAYQTAHMRLTTWVVGPWMLLEAATAVALAVRPEPLSRPLAWCNLALLAAIWLSTALLQVPQHERLLCGFQQRPHAALVRTNWLRTGLWSLRAAGLLAVLLGLLSSAAPKGG
ncbi:MAG: hypothetical protein GC160_10190 [Acidobacteria bacterium]|nr:hypothetical protein [Acidobacteriota bacterium]